MHKFITILMLFLLSSNLVAEEGKKPEFTEEQLNQLKATEEKYKDNPGMMKLIRKVKEQSGLTEETAETEAPPPSPPPEEPALQGDRSIAEAAYKNRDYATAIEHYQALAAEGDAEASLKLGTMYELGKGTDKDPAAAHAWYKKAADEGDDRGKMFLKSIERNTAMSEEDLAKAEENYKEISKEEPGNESTVGDKGQTDAGTDPAIKFSLIQEAAHGQWKSTRYTDIREVKISLEKFNPMQHFKPGLGSEHLQPGKVDRQLPSETTSDS